MLPYTFYTKAREDYPNSTHIGDNFSTPKNGSCTEDEELGGGGEAQGRGRAVCGSGSRRPASSTTTSCSPTAGIGPLGRIVAF